MRPRIVDYLNQTFDTTLFDWLVPQPAMLYATAMMVCLFVFVRRSRVAGLSQYHALGAAIWAMIAGLIGARLFYLLVHVDQLIAKPAMLLSVSGGTASWGAYLAGGITFWLYFTRHRQPASRYADVAASCLGLGPFIGRWSCFLNGDDFGTLSNSAFSVRFPHASIPFASQVKQGLIDPLDAFSLPVHPVQIYLSLNGLLLFVAFSWLWKRRTFPAGTLFAGYWAAFSLTRFFWEFFRGESHHNHLGFLTTSQVMAALTFLFAVSVGVILLLRGNRKALATAI